MDYRTVHRRLRFGKGVQILLDLSFPLGVQSAELYVSPSGSDNNVGTRNAPFRTIQRGVNQASAGTIIYVRGGVYNEEIWIKSSGTASNPITLSNYPNEAPVIDPRFLRQVGVVVTGNYVRVTGFTIRNIKSDSTESNSMAAIKVIDCVGTIIEGNRIDRVIGVTRAAHGIEITASDRCIIRRNTITEVVGHPESMGIKTDRATNNEISNNLILFVDKEAIRLSTSECAAAIERSSGDPAEDCDNFPDPLSTERIEGNIILFSATGIAVNNSRTPGKIFVRNNFIGGNWTTGFQAKHSRNVVIAHNTIHDSGRYGIDLHGNGTVAGDNYLPVVTNNIFSEYYQAWWIFDDETFNESVDSNFYGFPLAGPFMARFNFNHPDRCFSVNDIRNRTALISSVNGTYEARGLQGDPRFVDSGVGDFRLLSNSTAKGKASDGSDMGALASVLTEVGAERTYGLSRVLTIRKLLLEVESYSSQSASGPAQNAVDRFSNTYWEVAPGSNSHIVLRLPGNEIHELNYITLVRAVNSEVSQHYRRFAIDVDDGGGSWKAVAEPSYHIFEGRRWTSVANGETWSLPASVKARRVRLRILSGWGSLTRIPDVRLYGQSVGGVVPNAPSNLRVVSEN